MSEADNEIWKDVNGYEGLYQVSSAGRVRSMDRWITINGGSKETGVYKRFYPGKVMSPVNVNGYNQITLSKDGRKKKFVMSRLVADAFVENPDNRPHVSYKNDIRGDDRADNLVWTTKSDGKLFDGAQADWEPLTERQVKKIRELRNEFLFPYQFIADQMRLSKDRVRNVCLGKTYKYY